MEIWFTVKILSFKFSDRESDGLKARFLSLSRFDLRFTGNARLAYPINWTDFALPFFAISRLTAYTVSKPFDCSSLKSVQIN